MFAIKTNLPAVLKKLDEIRTLLDGGWQKGCIEILEQARDRVAEATPRSSGWEGRASAMAPAYEAAYSTARRGRRGRINRAFRNAVNARRGHLADSWRLRIIGGTPKSRTPVLGVVYNNDTTSALGAKKPGALLRRADGSTDGTTLLEVLEYGTTPHAIVPVRARALAFVAGGEMVFTRRVSHPGTKAYGMIRATRVWMTESLLRHTREWRTNVLARYWSAGEASKMEKPR